MAYQHGKIRVKGTLNTVTFYTMNGEYHVRTKSCLTGKKFWKHPAFERSRQSCKRFALGNKLASFVYRNLPSEKRVYAIFCQLKTHAISYIKSGLSKEEIVPLLQQQALSETHVLPNPPHRPNPPKAFPYALHIEKDYIGLHVGRLVQLLKKYTQEEMLQMAIKVLNKQMKQIVVPLTAKNANPFARLAHA